MTILDADDPSPLVRDLNRDSDKRRREESDVLARPVTLARPIGRSSPRVIDAATKRSPMSAPAAPPTTVAKRPPTTRLCTYGAHLYLWILRPASDHSSASTAPSTPGGSALRHQPEPHNTTSAQLAATPSVPPDPALIRSANPAPGGVGNRESTPTNASTTRRCASARFSPTGPQPASSPIYFLKAHRPRHGERSSCSRPPRMTSVAASITSEPNQRSVSRETIRLWLVVGYSPWNVPILVASKYAVPRARGPSEICPDLRNKPGASTSDNHPGRLKNGRTRR